MVGGIILNANLEAVNSTDILSTHRLNIQL